MSLIVNIILLELALILSAQSNKTQYFVRLSFNPTLQLISCISCDLHKLLEYFNGAAIFAFIKIPFVATASVFPNSVFLYSKDLTFLLLGMFALKLVDSYFE